MWMVTPNTVESTTCLIGPPSSVEQQRDAEGYVWATEELYSVGIRNQDFGIRQILMVLPVCCVDLTSLNHSLLRC